MSLASSTTLVKCILKLFIAASHNPPKWGVCSGVNFHCISRLLQWSNSSWSHTSFFALLAAPTKFVPLTLQIIVRKPLCSSRTLGSALQLATGTQVASTTLDLATIVDGRLTALGIVPAMCNPLSCPSLLCDATHLAKSALGLPIGDFPRKYSSVVNHHVVMLELRDCQSTGKCSLLEHAGCSIRA